MIITAGNIEMGPPGGALTIEELTEREVELVQNVKGIRFATGLLSENARIDFNDEVEHIDVVGVRTDSETTSELERIGFFEMEQGRQFTNTDTYKVIIGHNIAKKISKKKAGIMVTLNVGRLRTNWTPLRSYITPREASRVTVRKRFWSASKRYSSPLDTCKRHVWMARTAKTSATSNLRMISRSFT